MKDLKHLSVIDGAFLHLESPEMPMHVGSLHLFEPPADYQPGEWYEAVKAHVASRMHLAPVFTRKLALMPFDLANPVWIEDDDIDLDYHMRYIMLPKPGTVAQLEAYAARLHSSLLDRSRPLWEFYVFEGLADGRLAFYGKVHHAAIDGQAGVMLGTTMFDLGPVPRKVKPARPHRGNRYQLGVAELLSAGLENQLQQVGKIGRLLPTLARTLVGMGREAWANRNDAPVDARAGSRFKFAPVTPFNVSITNQRAFAGVTLPLDETKRIGKELGASINDMVLWLCSTALRGYLKEGRELPEATLVAAVPISLRAEGDTTMNNQVAGTMIDLGTQLADPMQRLQTIMAGTAAMKRQMGNLRGVIPTDFPSLGSPWLLSGLASLYGRSRLASRLRVANVTISNVPGAQLPVYLAGAKMLDYYPLSIVVHGVALNITVQSYMGQLCFGLIACRRAVPDVRELAGQMQASFETLCKLVPAPDLLEAPPAEAQAGVPAVPVAALAKPARTGPRRASGKPKLTVVKPVPTTVRAKVRGAAAR